MKFAIVCNYECKHSPGRCRSDESPHRRRACVPVVAVSTPMTAQRHNLAMALVPRLTVLESNIPHPPFLPLVYSPRGQIYQE